MNLWASPRGEGGGILSDACIELKLLYLTMSGEFPKTGLLQQLPS